MSKKKRLNKDRAQRKYHFLKSKNIEENESISIDTEVIEKKNDYIKEDLRSFGIISGILTIILIFLYYFNPPKVLEIIEKLLK